MASMNPHQFIGHYGKIFGGTEQPGGDSSGVVVCDKILKMINIQVLSDRGLDGLLDDTTMFNITQETKDVCGLDVINNTYDWLSGKNTGKSLAFIPWAEKINIINGEQRLADGKPNCSPEIPVEDAIPNNQLVVVAISDSNYGTTYVFGDKRMPNVVIVSFRGTASYKAAASYSNTDMLIATTYSNIYEKYNEKALIGVFKILQENIHLILNTIKYVGDKIAVDGTAADNSIRVVATGHSLGAGLATIFASEYVIHLTATDLYREKYKSLHRNIACFTLGSPRVLGAEEADIFCCLTQNCSKSDNKFIQDIQKKETESGLGKITYLRMTTTGDPIPALPKATYMHPCSEGNLMKDETRRDAITQDCLAQLINGESNRCGIKSTVAGLINTPLPTGVERADIKLAVTYDYKKPIKCVGPKKSRDFSDKSFKINRMAFHFQYVGISYAGSISSLGEVFKMDVDRIYTDIVQDASGVDGPLVPIGSAAALSDTSVVLADTSAAALSDTSAAALSDTSAAALSDTSAAALSDTSAATTGDTSVGAAAPGGKVGGVLTNSILAPVNRALTPDDIILAKRGDTVVRMIFYPLISISNRPDGVADNNANIVFFDLVPLRNNNKGVDNNDVSDAEVESKKVVKAQSASELRIAMVNKVTVKPEDVKITSKFFERLLTDVASDSRKYTINIITNTEPPSKKYDYNTNFYNLPYKKDPTSSGRYEKNPVNNRVIIDIESEITLPKSVGSVEIKTAVGGEGGKKTMRKRQTIGKKNKNKNRSKKVKISRKRKNWNKKIEIEI
jgi:hypothetical protein